ncbi:MAG: hypothetical protein Q7U74_05415, partial [Saprospiraceae bacterium]|nr:hypothetical protein [Saprospiraceae bacterium]
GGHRGLGGEDRSATEAAEKGGKMFGCHVARCLILYCNETGRGKWGKKVLQKKAKYFGRVASLY